MAEEIDKELKKLGDQLLKETNNQRSTKRKLKYSNKTKRPERRTVMPKRADSKQIEQAKHLLKTSDMSVLDISKKTGVGTSTLYKFQKEIREEKSASTKDSEVALNNKNQTTKRESASKAMQKRINELTYERDKMKNNWQSAEDKYETTKETIIKLEQNVHFLESELKKNYQQLNKAQDSKQSFMDKNRELVLESERLKRRINEIERQNKRFRDDLKLARDQQDKINQLEKILVLYMGVNYEYSQTI